MALRIVLEISLSLQSSLNVSRWNRVFFGQRVRQDRHIPAMQKNTVFDTARDLASPEARKCHPAESLPLAAAVRGQSG